MTKRNSTKPNSDAKADKPPLTPADTRTKPARPEGSPLFWHSTGRWCKKVRGKHRFFGRGSHDDALAEYERQKDDLHAGRQPREEPEGLTIAMLTAKFLSFKKRQRDGGELSPISFRDYTDLCQRLIRVFGKGRLVADLRGEDFGKLRRSMAKTWGPVRLAAEIIRTRTPFNWAYRCELLERPVHFGEQFRPPSRAVIRKHKATKGPLMFQAQELRDILAAATQPLKAMILLGINCGFSNSDVGGLPIAALDLDSGWATFAREKTGINRRCPLWPETVDAITEWLKRRPSPKRNEDRDRVFLTKAGAPWTKTEDSTLSKEFAKLVRRLKITGRTFYHLRHTLQTVGDEALDFVATRALMGHAFSGDIAATYRERISDERLRKVVQHVHDWVFAQPTQEPASESPAQPADGRDSRPTSRAKSDKATKTQTSRDDAPTRPALRVYIG